MLVLQIYSAENDYSNVLLAIPFDLNISERLSPNTEDLSVSWVKKDATGATIISLVALAFIIVWSFLLHSSHQKREARASKAKIKSDMAKKATEDFYVSRSRDLKKGHRRASMIIAGADFRPLDFTIDNLLLLKEYSKGIETHMSETDPELLCKGTEAANPVQTVRSTTSPTRISNPGKTGISLNQLLPFRLISVGTATLVVGLNRKLIKLPNAFHYLHTLDHIGVFYNPVCHGRLHHKLCVAGTVDENLGFFWWTGGIGLYATIAVMQCTVKRGSKGMLRLFRSIAPPTCEEFMFSDETSHPDDIRTLAEQCMRLGFMYG
ncbi:hypothetical protein BJ742DRAFT_345026 [Cladochytrium replicatum]|nr:hypothetical protein BJ742DRAFT_345026 [Cladochytrium replicatum]